MAKAKKVPTTKKRLTITQLKSLLEQVYNRAHEEGYYDDYFCDSGKKLIDEIGETLGLTRTVDVDLCLNVYVSGKIQGNQDDVYDPNVYEVVVRDRNTGKELSASVDNVI